MSDSEGSAPDQHHLLFVSAAAKGDEARLREIFYKQPQWSSALDHTILRQALQKATGKGNLQIVCLLLEWGAEIEPQRDNEVSPLFRAVEGRHLQVVMKLLEQGANPDWCRPKDGLTALFIACSHGLDHIVDALLKAGADPNARDRGGRTPLLFTITEYSAPHRIEHALRLLLHKGADIEARDPLGRTALLWAATNGNRSVVDLLLSQGADVSAANYRGTTALHFAAEKNHEETAELLLIRGIDHQAISDGGWRALHLAAQAGHERVTALLLDAGTSVNSQLQNGMTPLHWAAFNGHEDVVKLLLAHPDVALDIKDSFHRTPMLCAVERNHSGIARLLSPHRAGDKLSQEARAACKGLEATIVDFGQFTKKQLVSKESVYDLLYGWDEKADKPTRPILPQNVKYQPHLRWIHLPANNVAWVETLLAKIFVERGCRYQDSETFKALDECFDQEQHGSLPHDHSMRPFCQRIVPQRPRPVKRSSKLAQSPDTTPDRTEADELSPAAEPNSRKPHRKAKPQPVPEQGPKQRTGISASSRKGRHEVDESPKSAEPGNIVLFMPFLHYETSKGYKEMDIAIKNMRTSVYPLGDSLPYIHLINGYVNHRKPLHIRKTLDQYFYLGIDTAAKDKDQVVSRYCGINNWESRMLMVDQLWLWTIGKDLVITCFATRWRQPKNDPLNVLNYIIEETNGIKNQGAVTSAYHLATLIFNHCCNIFDRPRVDKAYQFLDMFESSTGLIINRQTKLLREFGRVSALSTRWLKDRQRRHGHSLPGEHDFVLDALLELGEESAMLNEINDIRDELNIMVVILDSQTAILGTLESALTEELREGGGNRAAIDDLVGQLRKRCREQQRRIETRYRDLQRMDRRAENAYTSLRSLLELKQMQSNALEAKFARDQAVTASKQGQAILVFTVVTIVFVPMSFIATLFTINIDVWSDPLPLPYVAKYTFGIGLSVSIPLIIMALTVTDIINSVQGFLIEVKNRIFQNRVPLEPRNEVNVREEIGNYARQDHEPPPQRKKRLRSPSPPGRKWRRSSPYPRAYQEGATNEILSPQDTVSKMQRHLRSNASWARPSFHRGRARESDDPERGRSMSRSESKNATEKIY